MTQRACVLAKICFVYGAFDSNLAMQVNIPRTHPIGEVTAGTSSNPALWGRLLPGPAVTPPYVTVGRNNTSL